MKKFENYLKNIIVTESEMVHLDLQNPVINMIVNAAIKAGVMDHSIDAYIVDEMKETKHDSKGNILTASIGSFAMATEYNFDLRLYSKSKNVVLVDGKFAMETYFERDHPRTVMQIHAVWSDINTNKRTNISASK